MNSRSKLFREWEEGTFWRGFVQHRSPISKYGDIDMQAACHPQFQWNICWNTKQSPLWRPKSHENTGRLVDHASFHRKALSPEKHGVLKAYSLQGYTWGKELEGRLGSRVQIIRPKQCLDILGTLMVGNWIYCVSPVNWQWMRENWSCVDRPSFISVASFLLGGRGRRLPWYLLSIPPAADLHWIPLISTSRHND